LLEKRQDVLNELFGDLGRLVQTLGKLNTSIQVLEVQIRDGKEKQAGKGKKPSQEEIAPEPELEPELEPEAEISTE